MAIAFAFVHTSIGPCSDLTEQTSAHQTNEMKCAELTPNLLNRMFRMRNRSKNITVWCFVLYSYCCIYLLLIPHAVCCILYIGCVESKVSNGLNHKIAGTKLKMSHEDQKAPRDMPVLTYKTY